MSLIETTNMKLLGWAMHGIGAVAIVVGGLAYYFCFYGPLARGLESDSKRVAQLERLQDAAGKTQTEIIRLKQTLKDLEERAVLTRSRTPDEADEAIFLNGFTEMALQHGIKILDYQRGITTKTKTHSQIEIEIQCEGPYPGLCSLVDKLHAMPRHVRVKEMSINSSAASHVYPLEMTILLPFDAKVPAEGKKTNG